MIKENLYIVEFDEVIPAQLSDYDPIHIPKVVLFNNKVISEEEVNKLIEEGQFIYEHDERIVVMSKRQYTNLCKE